MTRTTLQVLLGLVVVALLVTGAAGVVVHDLRCNERSYALCRRGDGSEWRDPSGGCSGGEDPRCSATGRTDCVDSKQIEPGRKSCAWVL